VLGATSFSQASAASASFFLPRGQSGSTRKLAIAALRRIVGALDSDHRSSAHAHLVHGARRTAIALDPVVCGHVRQDVEVIESACLLTLGRQVK
jgi:hypothetical protein